MNDWVVLEYEVHSFVPDVLKAVHGPASESVAREFWRKRVEANSVSRRYELRELKPITSTEG